jgi:RNA polymerase sigma-70 factor (family 1)
MPTTQKSDYDLWNAVRDDDELAFKLLFDHFMVRLYNAAYNYTRDREMSMEIVHDVFLSIWTRRKELKINNISGFLLKSVRYQIYNRMRASKAPVFYVEDYTNLPHATALGQSDFNIREDELQLEINAYLRQLPKRCHEIFDLSRTAQLSNDEIAQKIKIFKRSVENQITLALKHLKICLKGIAT